jgi:negative modulator of initiation of replication
MQSIKIEDDLFDELMDLVVETGKSFSDIIRHWKEESESKLSADSISEKEEGVLDLIESSEFQSAGTAIRRYLMILSHAYDQDPDNFSKILDIEGRSRKYFGNSREELSRSGKKVRPERIPDTPYWAITRISNSSKKKRLRQALLLLDYDRDVAVKAAEAID